jgi:putative Mg2+ transporter-C (MgtC) family protein
MFEQYETIVRLFLGAALGGIIGFERQSHGRPAGFRTHILVSLASVLIMIVSSEYYRWSALNPDLIRIDPARIAAGAITGIGFVGAGVIIKSGFTVQGLTTAACLWIVSAMGLAVGSGLYLPSLVTFIITILALWMLRRFEIMVPRVQYKIFTLTKDISVREEEVINILRKNGISVGSIDYEIDIKNQESIHRITVSYKDESVIPEIIERLKTLPYIRHFSLRG